MKTNKASQDPEINFVTRHLKEIVERSMNEKPVRDKKGEPVVDDNECKVFTYDSGAALKALELLGKHLGMFGDKKQPDMLPDGFDIIVGGTQPLEGI